MTLPVDINGREIHLGDTVRLIAGSAAYANSYWNGKKITAPVCGGTVAAYQADGVVVLWEKPQRHDGFTREACRRFLAVVPAANTRRTAA